MERVRRLYLRLRYDTYLNFALGALAAGLIQIVSQDMWQQHGVLGFSVVALAVLVLFLAYRALLHLIQMLLPPQTYPVGAEPARCKGLVMVLGGGSRETGEAAIRFHRERLEHVWCIITDQTESIARHLSTVALPAETHYVDIVDHLDVAQCSNAVQRAISHAGILGISPVELVCDITGGTTSMTAGAIKACLAEGIATEMVVARYDESLKALKPIAVIALDLAPTPTKTPDTLE